MRTGGTQTPKPDSTTPALRRARRFSRGLQGSKRRSFPSSIRHQIAGTPAPQALNEAEAAAWQTMFPHLVFPALATEKVQAAIAWMHVTVYATNRARFPEGLTGVSNSKN